MTRLGARGNALATAHAHSRELAARLQLPEEPAAGRGSRAAGAILKSDPRSPSLCVSSRVLLLYSEPSLLKGRTLGTRRRAEREPEETWLVASAACAAVTQHPLKAFFTPAPFPRGGAGLPTLVPGARARVAEVRPCSVGTPPDCAMPAGGHGRGRRRAIKCQ